jgi:hypothetical protein
MEDSSAAKVPGEQAMQGTVKEVSLLNRPRAQGSHEVELGLDANVPIGHGWQSDSLRLLYRPGSHAVQEIELATEKRPATHEEQVEASEREN